MIGYVVFQKLTMRHYVCGPPISDRSRIGTAGGSIAPARRGTTTESWFADERVDADDVARCAVGCGHLQQGYTNNYGLDNRPRRRVPSGQLRPACQRGVSETADPDGDWLTRPPSGRTAPSSPRAGRRRSGRSSRISRTRWPKRGTASRCWGSGQQTNEVAYAGKLARAASAPGTTTPTAAFGRHRHRYYQAFGSDAPPPTDEDIPDAETHVIWGANPAVAHPVMYRWIADSASDDDSELIVVDPVESETVDDADLHAQVDRVAPIWRSPGGSADRRRRRRRPRVRRGGDDRLRGDGRLVALGTGGGGDRRRLGRDGRKRVAEAMTDLGARVLGMGVNQSVQGTATSRALIDLCLATGNLRLGSGPFSLTGQANPMGTRVCSSKGTPVNAGSPIRRSGSSSRTSGEIPRSRLPDDPGPGPVGIVDAVADGPPEVC